jgi:hypothetical protein
VEVLNATLVFVPPEWDEAVPFDDATKQKILAGR